MKRALAAIVLGVAAWPAWADEVRIAAAGAVKLAVERIAPAFERATGHRVVASFDTVGAQRARVERGERGQVADVVMLSDAAVEALARSGRVDGRSRVAIGNVLVGIAVRDGAPVPDLGSVAALRATLLSAREVASADPARGATAGTHFAKVVDALGLRDALASTWRVMPFGVDVVHAVARGEVALGVSQSSEILQHEGVRFAGPLPPPHGLVTGYAAAAASDSAAARAWLDFLSRSDAQRAFADTGFLRDR